MKEDARIRELGLPAMTDREYKIYCKRREYIKAGDTKGLKKFDAKLESIKNKTVEQNVENKEESAE